MQTKGGAPAGKEPPAALMGALDDLVDELDSISSQFKVPLAHTYPAPDIAAVKIQRPVISCVLAECTGKVTGCRMAGGTIVCQLWSSYC